MAAIFSESEGFPLFIVDEKLRGGSTSLWKMIRRFIDELLMISGFQDIAENFPNITQSLVCRVLVHKIR